MSYMSNEQKIKNQILLKKGSEPYFPSYNNIKEIVTDIDHLPYTRFYRGMYKNDKPIIFEREAGWRPIRNSCYSVRNPNMESSYPNHCFETACSTVYPCYPQYLDKFSDKEALDVQLNRSCIVQYR